MKLFFTFLILCLSIHISFAQANYWSDVEEAQIQLDVKSDRQDHAWDYRLLSLNTQKLRAVLKNAPLEYTTHHSNVQVYLPNPDGELLQFEIFESSVMAPRLTAKFPDLRSYVGKNRKNPLITTRFQLSGKGIHATIFTPKGTIYIDPFATNQSNYFISYYVKNNIDPNKWSEFNCGTEGRSHSNDLPNVLEGVNEETHTNEEQPTIRFRNNETNPVTLRTYRFALACSGEYAQFHGGTTESVMAEFNNVVNRLNAVFERDLAVRLILVEDNDKLIFFDGANDPYGNGFADSMLSQNPGVIASRIGFNNYDIGHVLGTGPSVSGVASLSGVCRTDGLKGAAASTFHTPVGDPFVIAIVAHEVGHQFGGNHSFNSCHNVNALTSYEPGGGTTIMSYAGICADPVNNLQFFTDDYFHAISLEEIFFHSRRSGGDSCPEKIETGNNEPILSIPLENGFYIPISTPFELTADATDPDGDALTYCWEQFNLGPVLSAPGSPQGDSPLFRSLDPTPNSTRVFPTIIRIINGTSDRSEVLPTYSRNLAFRCSVRDNNPSGGGTVWEEVSFKSTATAGPFLVTSPNDGTEQWRVGDYTEVTWDVANTDSALVNCQFVNIKLSVDNGFNYPYTLLENTRNDGSAFITVPNILSQRARIRVEAADNIFFDISNRSFAIEEAINPGYTLELSPITILQHCLPDPVEIQINTSSILDYNEEVTLDLLGDLPAEASVNFSKNPLLPSENSLLTIDLGTFVEDTFNLQIRAVTSDLDTTYRDLQFITKSKDFSDFALLNPPNGTSSIILGAEFEWNEVPAADNYQFEIATNPRFAPEDIDESVTVAGTTHIPGFLFESNELYFWRSRPFNDCGLGDSEIFAFHTSKIDCENYESNDVPVNIPGNRLTTVESTLFVNEEGIISDLNVPIIRVNYQPVRSLKMSLVSPAGTEVVLFDQNCGGTLLAFLGFDDEAPNDIACPPDDGIVFKPIGSLSDFIGENLFGSWTLKTEVVQFGFGASGAVERWELEFCATLTPNSPTILNKDTLFVRPASANPITQEKLEVQDEDNNPAELTYTIVTAPAYGTLFFNNRAISVGDKFRQESINSFNVWYEHDGTEVEFDRFTFVVEDGTGGWLPIEEFNIKIDENAIVSTEEPDIQQDFLLYPNPATDLINVVFTRGVEKEYEIQVHNIQGQLMQRTAYQQLEQDLQINASSWPAGVYFISVRTDSGIATKRVSIQR